MADNPDAVCPNCKSPVAPGLKFCENCGTRIETSPLCPQCGMPLTPGVKFCETCGKPVDKAPPSLAGPTPVKESPLPAKEPDTSIKPAPVSESPVTEKNEKTAPELKKPSESAPIAPARAGGGSRNLIIAGIVALIVLAVVAVFVVLPMLSGPGSTPAGSAAGTAQASGSTSSGSTGMPASQGAATPSFVVKPTSIIPENYKVTYQAERNGITGVVTVTFAGGPGMNGIRETAITLTKSDGTVETKSWKPKQNGDSITLKGTIGTDHLEAVANFYNGDQYRVLDQIFEYKKKN